MIITERQFKNDTEGKTIKMIVEAYLPKIFKNGAYIFISHKHEEEEYVYRLCEVLKRYGFEGYVDWEDDSMPETTSGETAIKLKDRIKGSKKFILIATEAAIDSKWCNWEVGFADAHKYIDHIALLPIKKEYTNYQGEEYLQIYPSIQTESSGQNENAVNYYIKYPDGKTMALGEWLKT